MKKLIITLAVLLLSAPAWAGEEIRYRGDGKYLTDSLSNVTPWAGERDSHTVLLIREWASSGEICRVLGHRVKHWECTNVLTSSPPQYLYKGICDICDKVVRKTER
jgi:hypothetical protein